MAKRKLSSARSQTDFARLGRRRDDEIVIDDDAPEWQPEDFARAVWRRGLKPIPRKVLLSLRLDSDVVDWFRAQGPGYQSRMNALLRAYMEASLEKTAPRPRAGAR